MKKNYVNINLSIHKDDYELLKVYKKDSEFSITRIIQFAIHNYLHPDLSVHSELKPLQNLKNPVMETKSALEIPVIPTPEESPVIESATFGHRLERKVQPNWGLVMRAFRAKNMGKEYDESLEPFFKELFNGKHS